LVLLKAANSGVPLLPRCFRVECLSTFFNTEFRFKHDCFASGFVQKAVALFATRCWIGAILPQSGKSIFKKIGKSRIVTSIKLAKNKK